MDILGITIWREARSEGLQGMNAVAHVITNRAATSPYQGWSADPEQCCLQPFQFSCWNRTDRQASLYPHEGDPQYEIAKTCPQGPDPTNGCNCYYDVSIPAPKEAVGKLTIAIGKLRFYRV